MKQSSIRGPMVEIDMRLDGTTALVTGVRPGNLGDQFTRQLLERGAKKVYAATRRPQQLDVAGAESLPLDITDPAAVADAADRARDVDVLINNASLFAGGVDFVGGELDTIRRTLDTNLYGTLAMVRAFAPVLASNGGGALLNVLSAAAWSTPAGITVYGASKAALWSLTNGIRLELADQHTLVTGLVFGMSGTPRLRAFVDAVAGPGAMEDMMTDPADIVRVALDGLEAGRTEVLADQLAVDAKSALCGAY